jgi:acetyltransferase-like isoleucine patch superfamily enzyme
MCILSLAADMTGRDSGLPPVPARKPGRMRKLLRLTLSAVDPRAWLHLVRLVNHYNHTHVTPRRRLTLGPGAAISPTADFANAERITAGRGLRIGSQCRLWAGPATARIVIGDDVMLGPEVMVTAAGYRFNDGQPVTAQPMDEADVVIGDDVWIGTRAIILPGTTIGDGAIIGAGAVVRGHVPAMAIAVGIPARVVGQRQLPQT